MAAFSRLLVVRLGSMGDVLHTLPAVAALREAMPEAAIGWIIEERWAELLCALSEPRSGPRSVKRPLVDQVHTVDTKAWRRQLFSTQTWERIAAALSHLRAPHYDVAIDFQGAARSALLARWSGSPVVYGVRQPRESVATMFYTRQCTARGAHIVEQNFSLAEAVIGERLETSKVELPHDEAADKNCNDWLKARGFGNFVVLNPGAGWGAKQWPAERYGEVARQLFDDGFRSLINFGPGEEGLARTAENASHGAAVAAEFSLAELIALTRRAQLFIGGDTGPMHLAAALGVPVVALFGPTDPARNGPFGTNAVVLRHSASPTTLSHNQASDPGLLEITPAQVITATRRLLRGNRG
jgi:heptosyltransferase I